MSGTCPTPGRASGLIQLKIERTASLFVCASLLVHVICQVASERTASLYFACASVSSRVICQVASVWIVVESMSLYTINEESEKECHDVVLRVFSVWGVSL